MVGRTLMHYEVVAELGAGGMGVVYEAIDRRLERRVALKVLPADKTDNQRRARFLHEARTASALNDPHIVTIFDIFTVDDTDVLVMELVPGRTLRQMLDDGPLPLATALDIAIQVAEGVGAAHNGGVVHRDLKPANVMVTGRGRVKVLDFGLAKLVGGGSLAEQPTTLAPATVAGMLLGTVDYMSPEQARGEPIDARTDVFSLGAMLYEMIAGARPFTSGHALGVLHEIVYGTIVPVRTRRPETTEAIEQIVLRALERDLTRRYQTMEAFGQALQHAHHDILRAPAAVEMPTAALVPPPLPPHAGLPPIGGSTASHAPPPSPAVSAPVFTSARERRAMRRARRYGRGVRNRRSPWATAGLVIAILVMVNWTRGCMFHPAREASSEPGVREPQSSTRRDIASNVEDAVASGLLSIGSGSADLQLAGAKIYWNRARRTKDPAMLKKAEAAFNEAIRIGLDANDETEARDALRQLAALKTSSEDATPGDETSRQPTTSAPDFPSR
jgi:serine/threonine protein kinase